MDITNLHERHFVSGHIMIPFNVRQVTDDCLEIEIGRTPFASDFASVSIVVTPRGNVLLRYRGSGDTQEINLGSILEPAV